MQVQVNSDSFPYPTMFLLASRAIERQTPPVQPVGVFIAKQTVLGNGDINLEEQTDILMTDQEYAPLPESSEPPDLEPLKIHLENDLVAMKPYLDLVVVRDDSTPATFGTVQTQHSDDGSPPQSLDFGWRSRLTSPRAEQAGDVLNFTPNPEDPFALPNQFDNRFLNGSHLADLPLLNAGDRVNFIPRSRDNVRPPTLAVTIPTAPMLAFQINQRPLLPVVEIDLKVDTVICHLNESDPLESYFSLIWRAMFEWEDRLANTPDLTLEVR